MIYINQKKCGCWSLNFAGQKMSDSGECTRDRGSEKPRDQFRKEIRKALQLVRKGQPATFYVGNDPYDNGVFAVLIDPIASRVSVRKASNFESLQDGEGEITRDLELPIKDVLDGIEAQLKKKSP